MKIKCQSSRRLKNIQYGSALLLIATGAPLHAQAFGHWKITTRGSSLPVLIPKVKYPSYANVTAISSGGSTSGSLSISVTAISNNSHAVNATSTMPAIPVPPNVTPDGTKSIALGEPGTCVTSAGWVDANDNSLPASTVNRSFSYTSIALFGAVSIAASHFLVDNVTGVITGYGNCTSQVSSSVSANGVDPFNGFTSIPGNSILPGYLYSTSPIAQAPGTASSNYTYPRVYDSTVTSQGRARGGFWQYVNGQLTYSYNIDLAIGQSKSSGTFPASYFVQTNSNGASGNPVGFDGRVQTNADNGTAVGDANGIITVLASG